MTGDVRRVLRMALVVATIGCLFAWTTYIEPDGAAFGDRVVTAFVLGLLAALADTLDYRWLRVAAPQGPAATTASVTSESTAKLWIANFAVTVAAFTAGFSLFALNGLWFPVSLAILAAGFLGSRRIHRQIDSRRATYSPEPAP